MSETKEQILKIRDLDITFQTTAGSVHAIRGVNIDLMKGETVAIVGQISYCIFYLWNQDT